ncbi:glycoside hydrolase family 13 protein [Micromonospora sp. 4G57]|uniref:Glycoside hydrolase family 13 protein n=1 Tax=Micromonospora sicca TaxID=2202420 RepID=A0ABU5JP15_9ACTN|nr:MULTISPECIES: glycoside hydrolase family 13 protein [unclassified Micromonospora]MDZ5446026.1 glycoside hydrolase family 13 protein [Micromonospora sp. 4G57]MDZ5494118.1 glycoside hydrolase family 13 protein [Micromonospora sp. 4G53]
MNTDVTQQETAGGPATGWWTEAVIYQIYPRSFADSDGDGIGDLPGITARLGHLAELGVDAVWLSPFYPSPQADAGYDVADYRDVDPLFGTLADADKMIAEAKAHGLRVIVDLVPNHTSSAHRWFQAALAAGPGSPERQRYVFRDGKGPQGAEPPNDWQSVFGGPAWTRVPDGQWYLHLFDTGQPDLNWDSPDVRAEFLDILRFWLDRGVDGFRVDVAHGLIKQADLADWQEPHEILSGQEVDKPRPPMWDQDGVHEIYREWRRLLDSYGGERILVAEAWVEPAERLAHYVRPDEMHQAFNFEYLLAAWTAPAQYAVITRSLEATDAVGAPTTWVLSNHDVVRHASRLALPIGAPRPNGIGIGDPQPDAALGLRRARAASLLMLALPGSAYLYQGEELGLPEHTTLPDEARQDPTWERSGHTERGRDGCRVPIPWEADAPSYGFGPTDASWLPQPPSWAEYALDRQRGVPGSTYELYRTALRLRREHGLARGPLKWLSTGDEVLAFRNGALTVLTNFGPAAVPAPAGEVLHCSAPLDDDGRVPTDATVWVRA